MESNLEYSFEIDSNSTELYTATLYYIGKLVNYLPYKVEKLNNNVLKKTPIINETVSFEYNNNPFTIHVKTNSESHVIEQMYIKSHNILIIETISEHCFDEFMKECIKQYDEFFILKSSDGKLSLYSFDYKWHFESSTNKKNINNVYLNQTNKELLLNDIELFSSENTKQFYNNLNIPYTRSYMFYGPPGTGKTSLIKAIATYFNKSICSIDFDDTLNDKFLRKALKSLPKNSLLVLEDIDVLFKNRKDHDDMKHSITFSGLLNAIDGTISHDNLMIIMTTNYIKNIDSALKRRVDYFVEFSTMKNTEIKTMYNLYFNDSEYLEKEKEFLKACQNIKTSPNVLQKFFLKMINDKSCPIQNIHLLNELDDIINDKREFNMYT